MWIGLIIGEGQLLAYESAESQGVSQAGLAGGRGKGL
jgi:hypothetical protein